MMPFFIRFCIFTTRVAVSMNSRIDSIVIGVNKKDRERWGDFYDRYYAALCTYVSKILPRPVAVEDLVQEVFISVWEGKRIFSDEKELTNYLYRACYNNTLLYIRNHQIHDVALSKMLEAQKEEEDRIYALTVKEEVIRQLYQHINDLPPEQRRIILLRIEGFTWEEIAEQLKVSINTVKTQKTRSYRFLRQRMGDSMSFILFLF
ncbi:RNA polymerase ECF-type sigma factor [gut metagenome]|uniref:RNA polymerase ECF-type sigma factor n=1 Tax=gut metagenome TaxID=749906 RepID=J9FYY0_9ZZZZ